MNASAKKPKQHYATRWNLRTEEWERSPVGLAEWKPYDRSVKANPNDEDLVLDFEDDMVFIENWLIRLKDNGSRCDLCKLFAKKDNHIRSKWRRINKKLAKQYGLPENHQVLPALPVMTQTQKKMLKSHFTPKPKKKTLKDKVQALDEWMVKLLDLKAPKSAK